MKRNQQMCFSGRIQRVWLVVRIVSLCLPLLLLSCARPGPEAEIDDVRDLPQTVFAYLCSEDSSEFLSEAAQRKRAADFLRKHFALWEGGAGRRSEKDAFWFVDWGRGKTFFAENLRRHEDSFLTELIRKADLDGYPSREQRAISLENTPLRALPSDRPLYLDPAKPGEGYPFDYLQSSLVAAGTPLLLTHATVDGDWFFAETPIAGGWVRANAVARVDSSFVQEYQKRRMLVILQDGVSVSDTAGIFRFSSRIGSLFPLEEESSGGFRALVPSADGDGNAVLRRALFRRGEVAVFPLPATLVNLAAMADSFIGRPYGWGGLHGNRDCSATLRDLYAPFGLWLPRNSKRQAEAGRVTALEGLSAQEKEQKILMEATPLLTLLWKPGHIALYLGAHQGRAVVLQTLWGVRADTSEIHPGRHIVGRTVITTLEPGRELPGYEDSLLGELQSMTVIDSAE